MTHDTASPISILLCITSHVSLFVAESKKTEKQKKAQTTTTKQHKQQTKNHKAKKTPHTIQHFIKIV